MNNAPVVECIHYGFRSRRRKDWEFKSPSGYQTKATPVWRNAYSADLKSAAFGIVGASPTTGTKSIDPI